MYAITATAVTQDGKWSTMRQVPTFYLHPTTSGILNVEHACAIALDVLNAGAGADTTFHVTALLVQS